jgi:TonB family protein
MTMKTSNPLILCAALLCALPSANAQIGEPYYVPMKFTQTVQPVFPQKVLALGLLKGDAMVSVQIDAEGVLTDYVVAEYSYPAFADEAVAALKQWKFTPAQIRGVPVSATADFSFKFKSGGVVVDLTVFSLPELVHFRLAPDSAAFSACTLSQLDRIPTPTRIVKPSYTPEQARQTHPSHVTVEFYIDEQGHVRLPAVSRETNEANEGLAAAAVTAIAQWQFEAPLVKGKPALVLAEQDFDFKTATP